MNRLFPYSTSHYHCGCHNIEYESDKVNPVKSIYCEDNFTIGTGPYIYLRVLYWLRVQTLNRREVIRWTTKKS